MMDEKTAIEMSDVIDAFVHGRLTADEFEAKYLHARRAVADAGAYPSGEAGEIFDDLFSDVDAYTNLEPREPRDPEDLDASGLLAAARRARERLAGLV